MNLQATSVGAGPFNAAIKWTGADGVTRMWKHRQQWNIEDDAANHAQRVLTVVADAINEELTSEGFDVVTEPA